MCRCLTRFNQVLLNFLAFLFRITWPFELRLYRKQPVYLLLIRYLSLLLHRWSAYVVDGNVKVLNVEEAPSDFKVSGGDVILGQI